LPSAQEIDQSRFVLFPFAKQAGTRRRRRRNSSQAEQVQSDVAVADRGRCDTQLAKLLSHAFDFRGRKEWHKTPQSNPEPAGGDAKVVHGVRVRRPGGPGRLEGYVI
jgi:hypothetical protein